MERHLRVSDFREYALGESRSCGPYLCFLCYGMSNLTELARPQPVPKPLTPTNQSQVV